MSSDPRRGLPRTDDVAGDARLAAAVARLGRAAVVAAAREVLADLRSGAAPLDTADLDTADLDAGADRAGAEVLLDRVVAQVLHALPGGASSLRPVLNATGVVLHTNLGRAPLGASAVTAMVDAAGSTDVEFDLVTGARAQRGAEVLADLRSATGAEAALLVNNGAAALVLATTALAGVGPDAGEVVVSRGEMVEIGDGFRLPELIRSTGARIREVGTTNRTRLTDYTEAVGADTRAVLKVHPSNFRIEGFTAAASVAELATLPVPVIVDIGSGLLRADPLLPDEPDVASTLEAGADLVTCSGDKLLGGPQAGLVLGSAELVERLRRHPLYRALRVDKLTLAAMQATLRQHLLPGGSTPVSEALHVSSAVLRQRADRLAALAGGEVVRSEGRVGGGAAPGCRCRAGASPTTRTWPSRCAAATSRSSLGSRAGAPWSTCAACPTRPSTRSPTPCGRRAAG
ncbi:L-seryl-tRNA(Sec) selenium transferase [Arsenicicoccus piscis]|uniref:L-seryl-tRNA(Sec) selenium transferase n=1 Tax=Arsenicicoccus piscis TaxID=673954 RepID=A0ABQ6HL18_9MICO|nr:L-seryl-tRNA(Sec) selenium transferase [Arsenicicoccus piscis]